MKKHTPKVIILAAFPLLFGAWLARGAGQRPAVSPTLQTSRSVFASTRGRKPAQQQRSDAELLAWLRGPRNGLGDIYQADIVALRLAR